MDGGSFIKYYDPGQPLSSTNPTNTNIPNFGGGLTLMPNLNGGTLCPTFYSVSGGNYYYWNGATWVNTGHSTGNSAAVNLAGCDNYIYNLVGSTGQVYVYNGQGNGTLLTTLNGFSGGGPFDLVTDCDCNFFALKTSTTGAGQTLTKYSPSGSVLTTYTLLNMPHATAGGGFAIIGNMVYLKNNMTNGFFIGTISGSSVTFTQVVGFSAGPGDFASCPNCTTVPTNTFNPIITGALLTCTNPTANIAVSTTASPVTYSWTGPAILGATNTSVIAVGAPGVYTCYVKYVSCPVSAVTLTTAVTTNSSAVFANITPTGNICMPANAQIQLTVAHSSTSESVSWNGPGFTGSLAGDTIIVSTPGTYSVTVLNNANGCTASDFITLLTTPTVVAALSSNSLCALPLNGSPAGLTITPSGAPSYSLLTSSNYSTSSPNGTAMPVTVVNANISNATGTLIGANATCADTAYFSFSIIANPVIAVPAASVCPGNSHTFIASGASSFTWSGTSLNTYSGSTVISTSSATTVYTVNASEAGCFSADHTTTLTILPIPAFTVTPATSTICLGSSVTMNMQGSATDYTWNPTAGLSSSVGISVIASPAGTQKYNIVGALNGCTNIASATVTVMQPPVLGMLLNRSAICYNSYNGSPNSLSIVPSGAQSYTLQSSASFSVAQPNGPVMVIGPAGPPVQGITVATTTLIGVSGVCTVAKTQTFQIIANPNVTISPASASICPGQSSLFNLNGAGSYTWAPSPTLATLSPNSAVATPSITTSYAVTGSSLGCRSLTKNATIVVLPVPYITVSPFTSTVCAGKTVSLSISSDGDTFSWSPAGGLSSPNSRTVTAGPAATTVYTAVAVLNTCTNQAVATVSVIPMPVITASAEDPVICSYASTRLRASGAMIYNWYPYNELNTPSGNQVIATPGSSTTFTVWGFNGTCSGSTSVLVETVKRPDVTLKALQGQNVLCFGESLEIETSGAMNYVWTPSQYVTQLGKPSLVSVRPPVTTHFTLVASNNLGSVYCYQQVNYSVMVIPGIKPSVSGDVKICQGEKATLSASGGNTYKWQPPDGLNASDAARVVASPSVSTVYTVDVSFHTYCSTTSTLYVQVNPRPSVFAGRDTSYHINEPIFIAAAGTGTITWVAGDGVRCSDCPETQVHPSRSGCYIAEAVNEYGCYAQDDVCLEIRNDFTVYIPNTFTPNGDGLNDLFQVYGENYYNLELSVFDRWGELVYRGSEGWDGRLRGTLCTPDVYVYKVSYVGLDRKTYHLTGHVTLAR